MADVIEAVAEPKVAGSLSPLGPVGLGKIHYGFVRRDSRLQMMNLRDCCVEPRLVKTLLAYAHLA